MKIGDYDYTPDVLMSILGGISKDRHLRAALERIEFLEAEIDRLNSERRTIRGRPPLGKKAMTGAERTRKHRAKIRKMFDEELGNVVKFKG